jgi:hypothetical protein
MINIHVDKCISIDYKRDFDCLSSGCGHVCKCSKIIDIQVNDIDIISMINLVYLNYFDDSLSSKRNNIISEILYNINDEINFYTIDRICRKFRIWEKLKFNIVDGYYGEELDHVSFLESDKIDRTITKALEINDLTKRVEFLLNLEYGYILPSLKDMKWIIDEMDINEIIIKNKTHMINANKVANNNHEFKLNKSVLSKYDTIKCLVIETNDNNWKLIDGYHRISRIENTTIKVLKGIKCQN